MQTPFDEIVPRSIPRILSEADLAQEGAKVTTLVVIALAVLFTAAVALTGLVLPQAEVAQPENPIQMDRGIWEPIG